MWFQDRYLMNISIDVKNSYVLLLVPMESTCVEPRKYIAFEGGAMSNILSCLTYDIECWDMIL